MDVIDGQQRLFSIYRFVDNQFKLRDLEILVELNGKQFFSLENRVQRQIKTHTINCTAITNESHPEIKFDVFERLNTNTVPLNAQELRNCIYRGPLNNLLGEISNDKSWLEVLGKKKPDKRLRDEEVILRFFAYYINGVESYKTPLKTWLNDTAKAGKNLSREKIDELRVAWRNAIQVSLVWFSPSQCFRRLGSRSINRALFDLVMVQASQYDEAKAVQNRSRFLNRYETVLRNTEFEDLISRSVDHKRRTNDRFRIWREAMQDL